MHVHNELTVMNSFYLLAKNMDRLDNVESGLHASFWLMMIIIVSLLLLLFGLGFVDCSELFGCWVCQDERRNSQNSVGVQNGVFFGPGEARNRYFHWVPDN